MKSNSTMFADLFKDDTAVKAQPPISQMRGWGAFFGDIGGLGATQSNHSDNPAGWLLAAHYNVWARNCIRARAAAIAQTPLKLYQWDDDGDEEEVESHAILDLLETVNPINSNRISFKRSIATQLAIHGDCIVKKVRGASGQVNELYVLPRQVCYPWPSFEKYIDFYEWQVTGEHIQPDDVIRFWYPDPAGSIYAESPTSTALRYINAYNVSDMAAEAIDKRGGQGGGIVAYDSLLLGSDWDRVRREWDTKYADPRNAGMDKHMPPGTTYQSGALTAQQMERENRITRLAKSIMGCYGVPPANAGDYSDASVLANAAQQDKNFWQGYAIDEQDFIAEALNNDLLWKEYPGSYEQGLFLKFDRSQVSALNEDQDMKVNRAIVAFQGGLTSLNEARNIAGLEDIDAEGADAVVVTIEKRSEATTLIDTETGAVIETAKPAAVTETVTPDAAMPQPMPAQQPMQPDMMPSTPPAKARIVDFVGMKALTPDGEGVIESIHRFGDYGGMTATKAEPVIIVNGKAYAVADVEVLS